MKNVMTSSSPFESQVVSPGEIASLASKFHEDSNGEAGHDHEYRLCAEYMLAQKRLIECQVSALHRRGNNSN